MNGLTRELIVNGWHDQAWVDQHTLGFDDLAATVDPYTPEHVGEICGIDPPQPAPRSGDLRHLRAGAEHGTAGLLTSS
jgi:anaerobic selenocysteine-containing dehydrogenase